jgi:hypothetical protein
LKNAFMKMAKKKQVNRVLVSKFIQGMAVWTVVFRQHAGWQFNQLCYTVCILWNLEVFCYESCSEKRNVY